MSNVASIQSANHQQVYDSLVNFASGLGVGGKDKRVNSMFQNLQGPTISDFQELEALYQEDWIAGKIIDIIPDEMTREWRSFNDSVLDQEQRDMIKTEEKRLHLKVKVNMAMRWARLYGGCLLVFNVDDGEDPSEELNLDGIGEGDFKNLVIFDRRHASPQRINLNRPFEENFREPETYRLSNTSQEIHHSRVIRFDGQALPQQLFQRNNYWGDSVFRRIRDALINANISVDSTAGLLFESNVDVVKMDGLMHMLATDEGTRQLTERFVMAKFLKSNYNFTVIDRAKEDLEKLSNSFSGIGEIMDRFLTILSASSDIPATRLFGKAPVGMNATGESDLRNFYDMIASRQEFFLMPALHRIDQVMARSLGLDPDKMEFDFNPLWQIPDSEAATIRLTNAQAHTENLANGLITEDMAAQELKNNGDYSTITDTWIKELKAAREEAERMRQEEIENGITPNSTGESSEESPLEESEEDSETGEAEQE